MDSADPGNGRTIAVTHPAPGSVELRLAARGVDLWPAIEAAQYARIVLHDEPRSSAEREAIDSFVRDFARYTESWEEIPHAHRSAVLAELEQHLQTLRGCGLFVHWGTAERHVSAAPLPLAIITIRRLSLPTTEIALPADLNSESDPAEPTE